MAARELRRGQDEAEAIWIKCTACQEILFRKEVERRLFVCPKCGAHMRLTVEQRLLMIVDRGSFVEHDATLSSADALGFSDRKPYTTRLADARQKTGREEAVVCGVATLNGRPVALGLFDFAFLGGSMGSVVGEKLTRIIEHALTARLPVIFFSASGGARMQEGVLSLMQMAKTSVVIAELQSAGVAFMSVLTNPTTGGVSASYAMQGDVILAEPGAVIGFAGPRVIKQTIGQDLPEGFQTAEFLLDHGMIDAVVPRGELRDTAAQLLRHMTGSWPAEAAD